MEVDIAALEMAEPELTEEIEADVAAEEASWVEACVTWAVVSMIAVVLEAETSVVITAEDSRVVDAASAEEVGTTGTALVVLTTTTTELWLVRGGAVGVEVSCPRPAEVLVG